MSSLTVHLDTVHLERREHKCPDCPGVAFREKSTLTRHIDVVHLKPRDRACPYWWRRNSGTRVDQKT